jgi:hypothetical protein
LDDSTFSFFIFFDGLESHDVVENATAKVKINAEKKPIKFLIENFINNLL